MEYITLIGYLRLVEASGIDEHTEGKQEFYFEYEPEKFYRVWFKTLEQADLVPINKLIALSVEKEKNEKGRYVVAETKKFFSVLDEPIPYINPGEKEKKHVGLFVQLPLSKKGNQSTYEQTLKKSKTLASLVERYWKTVGDRFWDVKCRGFVIYSDQIPEMWKNNYNRALCFQYMEDHPEEFEDFDMNYWHVHGTPKTQYCGWATLSGNGSMTYAGCDEQTIIHEVGHNFGARHSTKDGNEYGDLTCVMGWGHTLPNAVQRYRSFGVEKFDKVLHLGGTSEESRQVLLAPIELDHHILRDDEYQLLVIPGSIYFSLRKSVGFWPTLESGNDIDDPVLYVHSYRTDRKTELMNTLKVGSTYNTGNITVKYVEAGLERAKLEVLIDGAKTTKSISIDPEFPDIIPSASLEESHSGLWFDPRFPGQGFDIQIKNGRLLWFWYTQDTEYDSRRYYLGTCSLSEGLETFDIITYEGGTFDKPSSYKEKIIGKGQLYFLGPNNGVFNYATEEHGRGSVPLTRLLSSNTNGVWWNKNRAGEGFTVHLFKNKFNEEHCWLAWYVYGKGESKIPWGTIPGTTQRWFTLEGKKQSNGIYKCEVIEIIGSKFMQYSDIEVTSIGSAELMPLTNDKFKLSYNITPENTSNKVGEIELERFF
jgi:hypothetical protein